MSSKIKVIIDDFRISHIFDIEDPIPEKNLTEELQSRQFRIVNDRIISHPPIRAIILTLATKNNVNVIYQKESIPSFIGTSGKDMREVLNQFDVLNNILTKIDATLHGRHTSTEMILQAKVFGEFIPSEIIPKVITTGDSRFNKIFGDPLTTQSITMHTDARKSESYDSIHIAPLARSPRYYFVQLVHRDKDLTKVVEFAKQGEQLIKEAITLLEEG